MLLNIIFLFRKTIFPSSSSMQYLFIEAFTKYNFEYFGQIKNKNKTTGKGQGIKLMEYIYKSLLRENTNPMGDILPRTAR